MGSCRAQAAWACTLSAALCSLWVVSGKSCLIPRDLFLGRVGTVKVSHERWGETETSIFQKKMELDILYGYESKCKAPIHTLNPQADPYPRSIPKTQVIQTDPYVWITAGRSIPEFWRNSIYLHVWLMIGQFGKPDWTMVMDPWMFMVCP